jgi:hypothetical protein
MIKITNEIDGHWYELVKEEHCCDGCAFLNKYNDCILPQEQRQFYCASVCGKLGGVWKEVRNDS